MRAAMALVALAAIGCYRQDLDPNGLPPFACPDGACPSGYRCAQQLCVADAAMDPPVLVAATAIDDAPPIPLWNGQEFVALWQQSGDTDTPGIQLATVARGGLGPVGNVLPETAPVTFSSLYDPPSARYVIGTARNDLIKSALHVVSTTGTGDAPIDLYSKESPYSPIGFSRPSLSRRLDATVTVAFTYALPPLVVSDNVFCARIPVAGGAIDNSCRPTLAQTQGLFATEVTVAEFTADAVTIFLWRAGDMYMTLLNAAGKDLPRLEGTTPLTHIEKMVNINMAAGSYAVIGQVEMDGALSWAIQQAANGATRLRDATPVDTNEVVPDVDGDGTNFYVCRGDPDHGASILTYAPNAGSGSGLALVGAPRPIPRYSRAPIDSCRIAAAPETGTIGILWRERIPPATGRVYFTTLPAAP